MEFEPLSEQLEWESRRVATAFGVKEFTRSSYNATTIDFSALYQDLKLWWSLDSRPEKTTLRVIDIKGSSGSGRFCQVSLLDVLGNSQEKDRWMFYSQGGVDDLMARVLYRLGFDDEKVLSRLPELTGHEKLELRFSMPREFWPQKWIEEAGQSGTLL